VENDQLLRLPPGFEGVALRESGDAFRQAMALAPDKGAGTLVFVNRFDLIEFAVVLEPDEPLRQARRAFLAGMTALLDALAVFSAPEKPLTITWPDTILSDGAIIGGGRLGIAPGAQEESVPDWLVFGAMLRLHAMGEIEPGLRAMSATLTEEGFDEDVSPERLVESFCRHLMLGVDQWQRDGFAHLGRRYLEWLTKEDGVVFGLDGMGNLVSKDEWITKRDLRLALQTPAWLDTEQNEPVL
jgi:biotin-(acetyl-CoA carboxylase) ligase